MTASATSPAHGGSERAETDSTAYTQLPSTTQPSRAPDRATTNGWTPSQSLSAATPAMRLASERESATTTTTTAKWDPQDLFAKDEDSTPTQATKNGVVAVAQVQLQGGLRRASSLYESSSAERGGWPVLSSATLHRPTNERPTTDGLELAPGAPPTASDKAATSAESSTLGSDTALGATQTANSSVVGETPSMDGTATSNRATDAATTPAPSSAAWGASSSVPSTKSSQSYSPVTTPGAWGAPEVTRGPATGNSGWGGSSTNELRKASGWNTPSASSTTSSSGSTQAHAPTRTPAAATVASSGGWNAPPSSTTAASSWTARPSSARDPTPAPSTTTATSATKTSTSGWGAPTLTTDTNATLATGGWGATPLASSATTTPAAVATSSASRSGWSPSPVKDATSGAPPASTTDVASTKPTQASGWDLSPDRPVVARSVGGWGAPSAAPSTRNVGGWGADVKKDVPSDAARGSGNGPTAPRSDATGRRDDGASTWNVSRRYDDGRNGGRGDAGRGRYGSSLPNGGRSPPRNNDYRSHDRRSQPRDSHSSGRGGRGGHYGSRGSDNGRSPSRNSSRDNRRSSSRHGSRDGDSYGNAGRGGGRAPSYPPERRGRSRSKSRHRDASALDAKRFKRESSYQAPPLHDDTPSFEFGGGESPRRPEPRLAEINGPPSPPSSYPRTPIVARRASPVPITPASEWFFAVTLGKKMVQCRAMATGLPFTRQPLKST
ncbi:hypothetical protein, variant [Saprolegnia diclina VS20]|uniref:Uncharacterized protein n=1 Tax=Saprolegnia diclina (strain VS20) TaxID=1156394 RepID=T0RJK2_SAPDV|nr:hypothetical protein, variant [Saprolegnia diclina VS20]EQC30037.1 hypothetical protein, variant [Saprolegnia diclina VS20]|eukprot:XP_008616604.1 hypothetical protein, variant [Saprolegnia diclina VS20]